MTKKIVDKLAPPISEKVVRRKSLGGAGGHLSQSPLTKPTYPPISKRER